MAYQQAMQKLVSVVQQLSNSRTLEQITEIVRIAARDLTNADGATFVLLEGDNCFYAEENAIQPLWKGRRFHVSACVSGLCMTRKQEVVIEDVLLDSRVPYDIYKPTFVKSMVIVPIRKENPIGAIGNYWATLHRATPEEISLLQALADTTSVAVENVRVMSELELHVKERTAQLQAANQDLEAFSYTLSHDLRSPLSVIGGFSSLLEKECASSLSETGRHYIKCINTGVQRMATQIDEVLDLYKLTKHETCNRSVNLGYIAAEIINSLQYDHPQRQVEIIIAQDVEVEGDLVLLRVVLENLLSNAWKYSSKQNNARIEFGVIKDYHDNENNHSRVFFVRDNGIGFNMKYATKLFNPFVRMHSDKDFPGIGIGLASVQRIIQKYGGKIWVETADGEGATFYFTLNS